jgi:hypothetical protein
MPQEKGTSEQLASFIAKFTPEIASLAHLILKTMRQRYPTALELVYDNYNALAIGFSPTERASDVIFSIAIYPRWISLFFLQARGLPDPEKLLKGSGNVARHIVLPTASHLDLPDVRALMLEAESRAKILFDPNGKHRLIVKSVSSKQRPCRPVEKAASTPPKPASKRSENKKS